MLKKEIGARIKEARINMDMSKEKLARYLGISGQYLGMIEKGNGSLSYDKLEKLCKLTSLSSDYILFGKDYCLPKETSKILSVYNEEQISSGCKTLEDLALFLKSFN